MWTRASRMGQVRGGGGGGDLAYLELKSSKALEGKELIVGDDQQQALDLLCILQPAPSMLCCCRLFPVHMIWLRSQHRRRRRPHGKLTT